MGKVLNHIAKFDPSFKDRLDALLIKAEPQLPRAEKALMAHVLSEHKLSERILELHLRTILRAINVVPAYSVESTRLTKKGRRDNKNKTILSWSAVQIARDRFGYLRSLRRGLFSATNSQ